METKPGCLTSFQIAGLAEDLLSPASAQVALSHVSDCAVCAGSLSQAMQDLARELTMTETQAIAGYLANPPARPGAPAPARQTAPSWAGGRLGMAAAAMVLLSAAAYFWGLRAEPVPALLAQASGTARPFEFRLPGAAYGRAQTQRGAEANPPAVLLRAQAELAKREAAGERSIDLMRYQAWSELLTHQVGTAVRTLEEARRLAPNNLDVVSILGAAYAAQAEAGSEAGFRPAAEALSLVLAGRPDDRAALYNRGLVYARLGEHRKASEDWRALLRLGDDDWSAEVRALLQQAEAKSR